jgi:hypothetical protein
MGTENKNSNSITFAHVNGAMATKTAIHDLKLRRGRKCTLTCHVKLVAPDAPSSEIFDFSQNGGPV